MLFLNILVLFTPLEVLSLPFYRTRLLTGFTDIVRAVGAVEAHLVYTERVVGSNPTPPTIESVKCKPKN